MWRRHAFITAIVVFILTWCTVISFAQAKDFGLSFGVKLWVNTWDTSFFTPSFAGTNIQFLSSDKPNVLVTPTIGLRYKRAFLGGSYAMAPTYDFVKFTDVEQANDPNGTAVFTSTLAEADRTDWDLVGGYAILPGFSLFAGYKSIKQEYTSTDTVLTPGFVCQQPNIITCKFESTTKIQGPIVGLQGKVPVPDSPLSLFGNVSYGLLKSEFSGGGPEADTSLISSETGIGYRLSPLDLTLSYKVQLVYTEIKDQQGPDITQGPVFGVSIAY